MGGPPERVHYVGSSTVAVFLRDAEPVYGGLEFEIDTLPESVGGERAIVEGRTDLAGVAFEPRAAVLGSEISATLVGHDAIAVIVNADLPIAALSFSQLRAVFTGEVSNWSELGGPDLELVPFIVGSESATNQIFRRASLGEREYGERCREIRPDSDIIDAVASTAGGIGQISFSFLQDGSGGVHAIAVEGERPSVTNLSYPIGRPLYLMHRKGRPALERFVAWTQSDAGQQVVMRHFVSTRVVGAVTEQVPTASTGYLIVRTKTRAVYDGGIFYYPHQPYTILTAQGEQVREVRNHRGDNDEHPTRVQLSVGTYLIRTTSPELGVVEFFVTVKAGQTTSVDVDQFSVKR